MVQLADTLALDGSARICADGSLVAEVFAARVGLQDYRGAEIDPDNTHGLRDKAVAKVYRPESEVFKTDSIATFAAVPVTLNHAATAVTADNWRILGVGEINGDVVRDGERVRVPLIVRDAAAVKAAMTTHKQLSMGYTTNLVFPQDGKHPDGTLCDAYQTDIRINHIALVPAARGGPELRIVDERPKETEVPKTMLIDGLTVDISNADTAEATIKTLISARDAATAKLGDLETQVATLSTDKAALETENKQLKDSKPTPAQLRDAAKQFAQVTDKAKALGIAVTDEMDEAQIMKAAVDKHVGDAAKNWTADQIAVSFATIKTDAAPPRADSITMPASVQDGRSVRDLARLSQF